MEIYNYKCILWFAIMFLLIHEDTSLHISKAAKQKNDCEKVIWANDKNELECPGVGVFPMAGSCDGFARCSQRIDTKELEPEVDYCPDGSNYIINKCIKSQNLDDCPQRYCPEKRLSTRTTTNAPMPTSKTRTFSIKPYKKSKKPLLTQLHPSKSRAASHNVINFISLLLLAINISYL